ncbi:MAG: T9SS type A sorting domain-containing protein [Bacteroidia bacterium]|nr:T9SS type A sorting domain-containing protein [Bacteroidia bacterium]
MKKFLLLISVLFSVLQAEAQMLKSPKPGISVNGSLCLIQNTVWSCVPVECDSLVILQGDSVEFCTFQEINLSTDTSYWIEWNFTGCSNIADSIRDVYPASTPICYWPAWDSAGVYIVNVRYNGWLSAYPWSDCYAQGPSEWRIKIAVLPNPNQIGEESDSHVELVYPQPASELLYINSESAQAILIMDVKGSAVYESANCGMVDVSSFPNGVYFAELRKEEGAVSRFRFVVQH